MNDIIVCRWLTVWHVINRVARYVQNQS